MTGFRWVLTRHRRAGVGLAAAILAAQAGSASISAPQSSLTAPGNVDTSRVLADVSPGKNWLVNGRDFGSSHFSPLRVINDTNVKELGLAWSLDVDSPMGMPTEPIVVDGTIYVPGTLNRVFAIDAVSGHLLWSYDPHIQLGATMMGSYAARVDRGVAVWEHKVFVGTGDCRVIALDAASGAQLWQTTVCNPTVSVPPATDLTDCGDPFIAGG